MELVRGVKITEYCDEKKLTTQQRLELFTQVCRAVQHAHQKGIIHRDLKPSNILVSVNDGVAVPKVIDFGIAKATTGEPLTDKTVFTAFEQFIGTPAYMSPEQALVSSLDIDTRTDIYALGVLLYELLTGQTPFDPKELMQAGLDEMRRLRCVGKGVGRAGKFCRRRGAPVRTPGYLAEARPRQSSNCGGIGRIGRHVDGRAQIRRRRTNRARMSGIPAKALPRRLVRIQRPLPPGREPAGPEEICRR